MPDDGIEIKADFRPIPTGKLNASHYEWLGKKHEFA